MSLNLLNKNSHKPWLNPRVNNLTVDGTLTTSGGSHNTVVVRSPTMTSINTSFTLTILEIQNSLAFPDGYGYKIVTIEFVNITKTNGSGAAEVWLSGGPIPSLANAHYQQILCHSENTATNALEPFYVTIDPFGTLSIELPSTAPAGSYNLLPVTYIVKSV